MIKEFNEEDLFNLLKEKILFDLEKRHPMSYRDGYSPKYDLTIELKCRKSHYHSYIIEKIKWDKLIEFKNVRYINSTPLGIYSFDLKKINDIVWFEQKLPKTTEFETNEKINKVVGLLPIKLAKNITYILNGKENINTM